MTATGCPTQACYVVSAVPAAAAGLDGIVSTKLLPQYAVDGNTATRFTDGQGQVGGEYFQIDLCQDEYVNEVEVNDTIDTTDVATAYDVDVSLDGTCWETVANSQVPAAADQTITFPSVRARFVRYVQTGNDANIATVPWFSIDEINVDCGSAPPDAGADASVDAGADAGADASEDARADAGADAGADASDAGGQ
jgi:hypothetical protein